MSFLGRSWTYNLPSLQTVLAGFETRGAALTRTDEYTPGGLGLHRPSPVPPLHDVDLPGRKAGREPGREPGRRECGSRQCTNHWMLPWRNRRRPFFEGQWACSGQCLRQMIAAAVRRELGEGRVVAEEPEHRHRLPLGLVMLAQGWITHPQLRRALEAQRVHGRGRIGSWLVSECGLDAECVTRALSVQWNCPVLPMTGFAPRSMALVMPRTLMLEVGMVPIRVAGSRLLYIGFQDRLDAAADFAVEQMSGLKVHSGLVEEAAFRTASRSLGECTSIATRQESLPNAGALAERIGEVIEGHQPVAARLVRLHRYYWLRTWLESGTMGAAGQLPVQTEDMWDHLFTLGSPA